MEHVGDAKWITLGHPSYVWRFGQDRRLALIQQYTALEDRWILDVGCGIGTYVRKFRNFSNHVHGIDVDEERVATGGRDLPNLQVSASEHLPYPDNTFDVVVLNEVIEHVNDDQQTITECLRVLQPGGKVVIFAPNRGYFFETHGIYLGKRYVFRLIPFVNWLPDRLRNIFCPHVRAYYATDIRRLFKSQPARIAHHSYVFPGFDNIVYDHPLLGRLLRRVCYTLEQTPFRRLGLSHFVVAEKTAAAGG